MNRELSKAIMTRTRLRNKFWKTVKSFLSDKAVNSLKITLVEKNEIINNEEKIAEIFNTYFTNIVSNLKIPLDQDTDFARRIDPFGEDDPITFILEKYKNHPSIIAIKLFCHENKTRRCFEKN